MRTDKIARLAPQTLTILKGIVTQFNHEQLRIKKTYGPLSNENVRPAKSQEM